MDLGVPYFNPMCWWRGSAGGTKDDGSPLASAEAQGQEMCSGVSGKETVSLKQIGTGNQTWLLGNPL